MLKPICVACQRFYRPDTNGVRFIEAMPIGSEAPPGNAHPDHWKPCKLWMGDLWRCHGCNHQIIVGTGHVAIAEHYQPHFSDVVAASQIRVQVNDC